MLHALRHEKSCKTKSQHKSTLIESEKNQVDLTKGQTSNQENKQKADFLQEEDISRIKGNVSMVEDNILKAKENCVTINLMFI